MAPGLCVRIEKRIHGRAHSTLNNVFEHCAANEPLVDKAGKEAGHFLKFSNTRTRISSACLSMKVIFTRYCGPDFFILQFLPFGASVDCSCNKKCNIFV